MALKDVWNFKKATDYSVAAVNATGRFKNNHIALDLWELTHKSENTQINNVQVNVSWFNDLRGPLFKLRPQ